MEFRKGILFIRLSGILNKDNYDKLNSLIEDFKYIVINIDRLSFIDMYGINSLIEYNEQINNREGKLFICNSNKNHSFFNKLICINNEFEAFYSI